MTVDLKARKRELRSELIAARARLTPGERQAGSAQVAQRLDALAAFTGAATVGLYAPLGTEVDAHPLARAVLSRGGRVAFPRAVLGERLLQFAACDPSELVRGPLGAGEPPPGARLVPLSDLACIVVPGVGFSRDGYRLGRGGGYYDVTLKQAPHAFVIGVAYAVQLRDRLPREPHDVRLQAVVTELDTLLFPREVTP
jgi:5-formyltetrahydrofolate cyclo-ligase